MSKRTIVEIILGIILISLGWVIGNKWQIMECKLDLTYNIVDVITLIVTIVMGIYIAWILEKEVQDRRIEKDMYLSKICDIERMLEEIDKMFRNSNGSEIDYKKIVNLEHRVRTKKNSIFKYLLENSHGQILTKLTTYEGQFKNDFKDLRNYLTQTNAEETEHKDIIIENNIAKYSEERTTCVLTLLNNLDNKFLEVKVLVNKM